MVTSYTYIHEHLCCFIVHAYGCQRWQAYQMTRKNHLHNEIRRRIWNFQTPRHLGPASWSSWTSSMSSWFPFLHMEGKEGFFFFFSSFERSYTVYAYRIFFQYLITCKFWFRRIGREIAPSFFCWFWIPVEVRRTVESNNWQSWKIWVVIESHQVMQA